MHWIDPNYLPETMGTIDQFLINSDGEVDGLLLLDGTEVNVAPHLSSALLGAVHLGCAVRIRGVRPRGTDMISAIAIDTPKGRILDEGPRGHEAQPAPKIIDRGFTTVRGVVKRPIHGATGEVRGAVLKDGRILRLQSHEADCLTEILQKGAHIAATGDGVKTSLGTVIQVSEIRRVTVVDQKPDHREGVQQYGGTKPEVSQD
jgi:hypothetical protein